MIVMQHLEKKPQSQLMPIDLVIKYNHQLPTQKLQSPQQKWQHDYKIIRILACALPSTDDVYPVRPDWAIYWTLGNFSMSVATISLSKSLPFLGNFCKGVKNFNFSGEIILGNFYRHLATFYQSHCQFTCTLDSGRLIFRATSSLMKMSGYLVLEKSDSRMSSWARVKVVRSRRCFRPG